MLLLDLLLSLLPKFLFSLKLFGVSAVFDLDQTTEMLLPHLVPSLSHLELEGVPLVKVLDVVELFLRFFTVDRIFSSLLGNSDLLLVSSDGTFVASLSSAESARGSDLVVASAVLTVKLRESSSLLSVELLMSSRLLKVDLKLNLERLISSSSAGRSLESSNQGSTLSSVSDPVRLNGLFPL